MTGGQDLRGRVLRAAIAELEERGYGAASIAGVAKRAGAETDAVYRLFPSKAELFAELLRTVADAELATINHAASSSRSFADELDAVVTTFAGRALAHPRVAWSLAYEPVDPPVEVVRLAYRRACTERLAEFVRAGVEHEQLPDQDPDLTAAALIGAILEALVGPLAPLAGPNADPDVVVEALTALCRRAVGTRL